MRPVESLTEVDMVRLVGALRKVEEALSVIPKDGKIDRENRAVRLSLLEAWDLLDSTLTLNYVKIETSD